MNTIARSAVFRSARLFLIPPVNRIIKLVLMFYVFVLAGSAFAQSTRVSLTVNSGHRMLFRCAFDGGTATTEIGSQMSPGTHFIPFDEVSQVASLAFNPSGKPLGSKSEVAP